MQQTPPTSRRALAFWAVPLILAALSATVMVGRASALSPAAVAPLSGAAIVPARLAYAQQGRVWWLPASSGAPRSLDTAGYAAEAVLSPDGRQIAFLQIPASALGQAPLPAQLWLADLASGASWPLADGLALREQLAWSPDGAQLALVERGQLALYDARTGAREAVSPRLSFVNGSYAGYAWLPAGDGLVYLTLDDAGRQWVQLTTGARLAVPSFAADPFVRGGVTAIAVAPSPGRQAVTLLLAQGALLEVALEGGPPTLLTTGDEEISAFAWSDDGARLAYAAPNGLLWRAVRGASGLGAAQQLAPLQAPITRLRWQGADALEATLATRGGQGSALIMPASGATRIMGLSPLAAQAAPPERPSLATVSAPFSWYRFQGDTDSGVCASTNCGPTTVAMAIEFARNDLYVPISEIRSYMTGNEPCGYGTNGAQLRSALTAWGVAYQQINGLSAVRDAINLRGHIVIVPVMMADIMPGVDYETWNSSPANVYGRYYSYALGHWLLARGVSADGQWVQVYDPNVWPSGKYYYADGAPKGRDRLYRYSEFATALANNGSWAIEIMATPAIAPTPTAMPSPTPMPTVAPTATPAPTSGAPQPPAALQASNGLFAAYVALSWAQPAGATFYTVHRADAVSGEKRLIGLPARATWEDFDIAVGVNGYYWVTACNTNGCSAYAGPVVGARASEPAPEGLPPPDSLDASAWTCADDVDLSWSAVAGATHYEVRRSTSLDDAGELLSTPASTAWADASAAPGQVYWYRAAACGSSGCGALSAPDQGVRAYPLLPARAWAPLMIVPGR